MKRNNSLMGKIMAGVLVVTLLLVSPMYSRVFAGEEEMADDLAIENITNNIATNDVCTVSSNVDNEWWGAGLNKSNMFNKQTGSDRYSSAYATSQTDTRTITFSYDKVYDIESLILYPYISKAGNVYGFPVDFTVSVLYEKRWVPVCESTGNDNVNDAMKIAIHAQCKGVKIEVTKLGNSDNSGEPYVLQLSEIAIVGVEKDYGFNSANNIAGNAARSGEVVSWSNDLRLDKLVDKQITNSFYTSEYTTNKGTQKWIGYTFDENVTIDEVQLYPHTYAKDNKVYGMPKQYNIAVSLNGSDYITVKTITETDNTTIGVRCIEFPPITCKYVKITATELGYAEGSSTNYALQLDEVAILKSAEFAIEDITNNIATNDVCTVSSHVDGTGWGDGLNKRNMFDKKIFSDRYSSAYTTSQTATRTITFSYDKVYDIESLILYPYISKAGNVYGFPVDFTVSVLYGKRWVPVCESTGNDNVNDAMKIAIHAQCKGVKIEVTKLGNSDSSKEPYVLQLSEIAIAGVEKDYGFNSADNIAGSAARSGEVVSWSNDLRLDKLVDKQITNSFYTSEYTTNKGTQKWIGYTFDENVTIDEVQLYPHTYAKNNKVYGMPKQYNIAVSLDGVEYVTVKTITETDNTTIGVRCIEFSPVTCKYVKITATELGYAEGSSTNYALQLDEVAILKSTEFAVEDLVNDITSDVTITSDASFVIGLGTNRLTDGIIGFEPCTRAYEQSDASGTTFTITGNDMGQLVLYPYINGEGDAQGVPTTVTVNGASHEWTNPAKPLTVNLGGNCTNITLVVDKLVALGDSGNYTLLLNEIAVIGQTTTGN